MQKGIVYTETMIHSAPVKLAAEAPYQIALVDLEDGTRRLVRMKGTRVQIGDQVQEIAGDEACFEVQL